MAITKVGVKPGSIRSSLNERYQRTYQVDLIVETDSATVGPQAVLTASDLSSGISVPAIGQTYSLFGETDSFAYCQSLSPSQVSEDGKQWEVSVSYGPWDPALFGNNPVDWPIKVQHSSVRNEIALDFDKTGTAIRNSAGQRFQDPVTAPFNNRVITVRYNVLVGDFSLDLADILENSINNDTWNGFTARTVKCNAIGTSEEQFDSYNGVWYYTLTVEFEINKRGWKKELLDQGFSYLTSGSPRKLKRILDKDGQPVDEPTPLDGSGGVLSTSGTPVTLTFYVYDEVAFNTAFPIDLSASLGRV